MPTAIVTIAQAMMGPIVRLRGLSARINYPGGGRRHPNALAPTCEGDFQSAAAVVFSATPY